VKYAQDHHDKLDSAIFTYYSEYPEKANCANFISQAIAAGLTGETNRYQVKNKIPNYNVDVNQPYDTWKWYFLSNNNRSVSWASADILYKHMNHQINIGTGYTGLHFKKITQDTPTKALEFSKMQKGDIIFADWGYNGMKTDGKMDHVMIITHVGHSYASTYVAYQGGGLMKNGVMTYDGHYGGISMDNLGGLGSMPRLKSLFYVYRPTFYKQ